MVAKMKNLAAAFVRFLRWAGKEDSRFFMLGGAMLPALVFVVAYFILKAMDNEWKFSSVVAALTAGAVFLLFWFLMAQSLRLARDDHGRALAELYGLSGEDVDDFVYLYWHRDPRVQAAANRLIVSRMMTTKELNADAERAIESLQDNIDAFSSDKSDAAMEGIRCDIAKIRIMLTVRQEASF